MPPRWDEDRRQRGLSVIRIPANLGTLAQIERYADRFRSSRGIYSLQNTSFLRDVGKTGLCERQDDRSRALRMRYGAVPNLEVGAR